MNRALRALQHFVVLAIVVGSAQAAAPQEEQESKRRLEIRHTMTISTTPPAEQKCMAQLELTYFQKNTVAVVDSTLSNTECGASSGDYVVLVRFRDENNEMQTLQYSETWQRDDDQAVASHNEYLIGENVDLVTVRSRKLHCICDPVEEEAPEE